MLIDCQFGLKGVLANVRQYKSGVSWGVGDPIEIPPSSGDRILYVCYSFDGRPKRLIVYAG